MILMTYLTKQNRLTKFRTKVFEIEHSVFLLNAVFSLMRLNTMFEGTLDMR